MNKLAIALASAGALALAACSQAPEEAAETDAMAETTAMDEANAAATAGTVVEVAQGNPDFSTLVSAVTAADLGTTLSGAGPYTVFAPTNAAFEKVPQATRDTLMSPAGKEDLTGILTYHVVEGETLAAALTEAITAAERVPDCGDGDQWPKERKPIFFMSGTPRDAWSLAPHIGHRPIRCRCPPANGLFSRKQRLCATCRCRWWR